VTGRAPEGGGGIDRWLPSAAWLRAYQPAWLRDDLVAGLVLAAVLVPVGMGYARAAGLPPETGLYATLLPLLVYAILGPSRVLVLGPDSSLAPLIAAAVLPLAAGDPQQAVALAGTLAILAGAVAIGLGVAGFGFLATLLSRPVRVGYLNGVALVIIVSQLPGLLGFEVVAQGAPERAAGLVEGLRTGSAELLAVAIGLGVLATILVLRRVRPAVPAILLGVVAATIVVVVLGLRDRVAVVGAIPPGLPTVGLPPLDPSLVTSLLPAAVGIAIVSFADTSVLSRSLARRGERPPDQGRELIALGAADVASGLASGFPVSSSTSRTPVAVLAGARTQLTGVIAAVALAAFLLVTPDLLADLPVAALAAVVIASGLRIMDVDLAARLARTRPSELVLLGVSFLGVVLVGVLEGVVIAVTLSLLDLIRRAWRPYEAVLGRLPDRKGYHDASRHADVHFVPGLLMYRWDAPLFFANADLFRDRVRALIAGWGEPVRTLLVAAEPITDIDWTAAEMLEELLDELEASGVRLVLAELKGPVKDRLRAYGLYERIGDDGFFPTVGSAVRGHLRRTGVAWSDPGQAGADERAG
jgi:high affinity sulfate transporter 1